MITRQEFEAKGEAMSREANVLDGLHGYFIRHRSRLYDTCRDFQLFNGKLGDVLEIGPFFGYVPFVLRPYCSSYVVLEGDDPAAYPLKPLYQNYQIELRFVDLFETFGPTHEATHLLDFPASSFDTILCWGTMEHFNFNPAKFVTELARLLKPGGRVYITVPNKASVTNLVALLFGWSEPNLVESYYKFEDYVSNGKKAFYGFHWREYTGPELKHLFFRGGLGVRQCNTAVAFQANPDMTLLRRAARCAITCLSKLLPRYSHEIRLIAQK